MFLSILHMASIWQLAVAFTDSTDICSGRGSSFQCSKLPLKPVGAVESYCVDNGEMVARCCLNKTSTAVLAIDLRYCNISVLDSNFFNGALSMSSNATSQLSTLEVVDLSETSLRNDSFSWMAFRGMVNLVKLLLPQTVTCPNPESWENRKVIGQTVYCEDPTPTCQALNITCPNAFNTDPPNSYCRDFGPGFANCECTEGYSGYKCLRKGQFPMVSFLVGAVVTTVMLSASLFACQRYHIVKQPKRD